MQDTQATGTGGGAGTAEAVKERYCPKCKGAMVKRTSKFGPFWGCANYPKCKHIDKS